jgi:hypothetical protein
VSWEQIEKLLRDGSTTMSTDGDTFTTPQRVAKVNVEIDPDLLPTPGRVAIKRPLPAVTMGETPKPPAQPVGDAPPMKPRIPAPPAPASPPVTIQEDEETASSWEEPTQRDAERVPPPEEPQTQTRIELPDRRRDTLVDEPSTRPMLVRPKPPATMDALDYARIAAAAERGEAADALYFYGLTVPDLPRLEREWRERSLADPAFAEAFAKAVAERRSG